MTRSWIVTAILIATLSLAACGNPAAPQGNYGIIKGTVTSTSGQPVAGATILIDFSIQVTTKSDGTYEYDYAPVTTSTSPDTVSVTASGYQSQTQSNVQVQQGKPTVVNFTLSPA